MKHIQLFEKKTKSDILGKEIYRIIIDLRDHYNDSVFVDEEIEKIKILINDGANINYEQGDGTLLVWATYRGYYKIVKMLINAGADVNLTDDQGCSPLIWVHRSGDNDRKKQLKRKLTSELIEAGADWNIINDDGLDFTDYIKGIEESTPEKLKEFELLIKKYPNEYATYLMKNDAGKYNL